MTLNEQILAVLTEHGPLSAAEIGAHIGRAARQNTSHISRLAGRDKRYKKRIYICKWIRREAGVQGNPHIAIYKLGDKPDAPRPTKLPDEVAAERILANKTKYRTRLSGLVNLKRRIARGAAPSMWDQLLVSAPKDDT